MFTANRETFLKDFDFQKEMLLYCRNDVQLLREACIKHGTENGVDIWHTSQLPWYA